MRLPSDPSGFATIISRGTTTVAGTAQTPVRISSWDTAAAGPGRRRQRTAARSSCRSAAGWTSTTGGSSTWASARAPAPASPGAGRPPTSRAAPRTPAGSRRRAPSPTRCSPTTTSAPTPTRRRACAGRATPSPTTRSTASTRTTSATTSSWRTTPPTTTASTASSSPGAVDGNVLRGNTAYANAGHGFMIDDGRSTASATAEARIDPSNDNLVTGNVAYDNAGSGVEIEGGTGNVVADNHLVAQRHRGARQGRRHGLGHRQPDRRQRPLRGARARPGSPGGDRRQPHLRVVGGGQPRRGEQRDAGREPVDRRLDTTGDRRAWPSATRRGSTGWASSCAGIPCWCCGR